MRSWTAWKSSDASVTTKFYRDLDARGPIGMLAHALFKANKSSYRAKRYRGGNGQKSYRDLAYNRKRESLYELSQILSQHAEQLGIVWGWKVDETADHQNKWVLFVVIPQGQVSFHSPVRHAGPGFVGQWDGKHVSTERILGFTEYVLAMEIETSQLSLLEGGSQWPMIDEDSLKSYLLGEGSQR